MVERVLFGPGGATEVTLALIKAKTDNLDVALSTRGVTGITDTQMRATPVPVSGTVTVGNFPGTQPVSGPLTDGQLRASAVPVSGSFFQGTQPVSGPLTDTQLRASAPAVRDDFVGGDVLADQTGAGAVLTFTFPAAVQLVVVHGNGLVTDVARADPFGGTPTATLGIPCADEAATYLPVITSSVKVFTPVGMVVTVWGFRRA